MRLTVLACLLVAFVLISCDTDITGERFANQPPDTQLSVRDTSLVDNIPADDRLTSTVSATWSGTDPDGFVQGFQLRFFDEGQSLGPEEGWSSTVRNDTLILLPIPRGERVANVVFEVRALDNEGVVDPSPARTVYPIQNSPPTLRLNGFELPPDTTFTIASFSWIADDPEGITNLASIEVSLNDSLNFVELPADIDFITLVAADNQDVTEAEVYLGRAFQRSQIRIPDFRLDDTNVLYLRAKDLTDTTSIRIRFPADDLESWYVRRPQGRVLFVNDYRKNTWPVIEDFHRTLLQEFLPSGEPIDVWNITLPFTSGSTSTTSRSESLPSVQSPMLDQTLALYDYIYWVSTNSTNNTTSNNLPFAAGATNQFFEEGGRMMVHSPITLPSDPSEILGNPAVLLLPLNDLVTFPDTLRSSLRLLRGATIAPNNNLPGISQPMPTLKTSSVLIGTLPFVATSANAISVFEAEYQYITRQGGRRGVWPFESTIASISQDQRVGLFALPLISDASGLPLLVGENDDPEVARDAIKLMLESLGFPKR